MVASVIMSQDDAHVEFGREVRRRREALGLTLEQLSERSGLTPNYIGTIENGRRDPSWSTVQALAKGLDMAPGEFFGPLPMLSDNAVEMAKLFDQTSSDIQAAILHVLRSVVKKPPRK